MTTAGADDDGAPDIDGLLDRAIRALSVGDRSAAAELAEQAATGDGANDEAEELLSAPTSGGEMRRLTILFADVRDPAILGEATFKAAAALEQLRDPRAKDMYKKVVADYGSSPYAAQARGKI